MYISRDMNGSLVITDTEPVFSKWLGTFCDKHGYAFTVGDVDIPDLKPGDCRQLVLGDYLFEGGVSVASQK